MKGFHTFLFSEICLQVIYGEIYRHFYQNFSSTWVFSAFWTLTNVKKQLFQVYYFCYFFKKTETNNFRWKRKQKNISKNISSYPRISHNRILWYRNVSFQRITAMCEAKYFNKLEHFVKYLSKSFFLQNNSKNFHLWRNGVLVLNLISSL